MENIVASSDCAPRGNDWRPLGDRSKDARWQAPGGDAATRLRNSLRYIMSPSLIRAKNFSKGAQRSAHSLNGMRKPFGLGE